MQEFQLRVIPLKDNNFSLELYQCAYKQAGQKKRPAAKRIGQLKGEKLLLARQSIYAALKANSYDPKTLSKRRQAPYSLSEDSGVRLAILCQALQPLSKSERIQEITTGIMAMSDEEAHYWFGKINHGKRSSALKAIRVLLS